MSTLEILIVVLIVLWLLGVGYNVGALVHLLLIVVVILLILRLIQGRPIT